MNMIMINDIWHTPTGYLLSVTFLLRFQLFSNWYAYPSVPRGAQVITMGMMGYVSKIQRSHN